MSDNKAVDGCWYVIFNRDHDAQHFPLTSLGPAMYNKNIKRSELIAAAHRKMRQILKGKPCSFRPSVAFTIVLMEDENGIPYDELERQKREKSLKK